MMLLLHILLTLVWLAITAEITYGNVALGLLIAFGVISIGEHNVDHPPTPVQAKRLPYPQLILKSIAFVLYFLKELLLASWDVFLTILFPSRLQPSVIAIPLDLTRDIQITLLGNLITLTPGTLTLEVSADKKTIFVHGIRVGDPETFRQQIKAGFEKRILEVLP